MAWWWSWLLTAVGVVGLYFAGSGKRLGWAIGISAQLLWLGYAISTRQWGFLVSAGAYGWVYVRNWVRWTRQRKSPPVPAHENEDGGDLGHQDSSDIEVWRPTPGAWEEYKDWALRRLDITYEELERQARARDFQSPEARDLWVVIGRPTG